MEKSYVIGITGGSGSGKTTIIQRIRETFPASRVCILSQDDYYRPKTEQHKDEQGIENFDLPDSIDKEAFARDLQQLMSGETVRRMEYTFNNEQKKPRELVFEPAPIIIVEGIFVFHYPEVRDLLNLKVFVHAKENLKVIRRIRRDQAERNYPLEDVLYRYEKHVLPTYEAYIAPYKEQADLVINNNEHFEEALRVLLGFLSARTV
jgi:uridine kinase